MIGPAGRRLYGAVKGILISEIIFLKILIGLFDQATTVVSQRCQLEKTIAETKFPELPENIYNKTRHCAHEAKEIYFQMKRRRHSRSTSPAEMACHMGQRQRLQGRCKNLIGLFAEQTFPIMKKRHLATVDWFRETAKYLRLIQNIKITTNGIGKG